MQELMHIIGRLAMAASLLVVFMGFPHQICQNYKSKSAKGLSFLMIIAACIVYPLWAIYGFLKTDWYLIVPQSTGTVLAFMLLAQKIYYFPKLKLDRFTKKILNPLYPQENIFLVNVVAFEPQNQTIMANFRVPQSNIYTKKPIIYVTAIEYLFCLNQICYLLIGHMINETDQFYFLDLMQYVKLIKDCKLYLKSTEIIYAENIPKNTDFQITAQLISYKYYPRSNKASCIIEFTGPIRGTVCLIAIM